MLEAYNMSINEPEEYKQRYIYQVLMEFLILGCFVAWASKQTGCLGVLFDLGHGFYRQKFGALLYYVTFLWSMLMPLDSLFNSFYDKLLAENDTSRKYKLLFLVPLLNIAVLWWLFVEKIDKNSIILFLVFYIAFISSLIGKILKLLS